jgi:lipopolysaccharide/colanic/teichoic acid biosynthesis glycosyltransferase
VGKDGKMIGVYKFRTMYSYSEYLQPYIYEHNHLQQGGKFAHDYRVTPWGRWMRKLWIDELPMFINLFRGELKLVGVRPLSRHYFCLYTPEMQELRTKVKPGLLPPFYYERQTPQTIEEVQSSELRYIEAYMKHSILTDVRYFFGTIANIILRGKTSK